MKYTKIEELINDSIRVTTGMIAYYPQFSQAETINVSEIVPKFPGRYAINNSTVAFVHDGNFYVTPYTRDVKTVLVNNGFKHEYFNVPFSNWDYPQAEVVKWNALRENARQSYKKDFVSDCEAYCDEQRIKAISDETLKKCFEMPECGVKVKHHHYEETYYPIMNQSCLDSRSVNLGHYCFNNGRVVFVYRNGKTYVAKGGYKIIEELRAAGYTESGLFVPFSNGEVIQDTVMRARWESLAKI